MTIIVTCRGGPRDGHQITFTNVPRPRSLPGVIVFRENLDSPTQAVYVLNPQAGYYDYDGMHPVPAEPKPDDEATGEHFSQN